MINIEYFNGTDWIPTGVAFNNEKLAWISLGDDDMNYRTVDSETGKVLTDKRIKEGMKEYLRIIFDKIKEKTKEADLYADINDMKDEYVWDWEDEFDSLEDAYDEQGRGAAETATLESLITANSGDFFITATDHGTLLTALADYYNIFIN